MKFFRILLACILLLLAGWLAISTVKGMAAKQSDGDYVVVLHGMGRTPVSMKRMENKLEDQGYIVINKGYPSLKEPVPALVSNLCYTVETECRDKSKKIHFVTHSLGGILVRCYLKEKRDINLGRVVMLAPPNSGSEVTDTFRNIPLYGKITGKAGQTLGTRTNDLPKSLGPVDFELGVIAGNVSMNPLYSSFINGANDGKVSVKNTQVAGMKDMLVVPSSHTWIMNRQIVIDQVIHFLRNGKFHRK